MAESAEEMHHWITLLQRTKGDTRVQGQEFIIRGERPPTQQFKFHHAQLFMDCLKMILTFSSFLQ